jgi:two-component system, LuxR family, response regulator FixJ
MKGSIHIALVDDDAPFLMSFADKLSQRGIEVHTFPAAPIFLKEVQQGLHIECVVADVRMPGMSGLELQQRLVTLKTQIPLILVTGYGDVDVAVSAMKAGAMDFLGKPVDEERLVTGIQHAVSVFRQQKSEHEQIEQLASRIAELSERQRQVLDLVVDGLTSKQIAAKLDISPRTVENYRAFVMEHIGVGNIAQLVRSALRIRPRGTGSEA